LDGRNINSTGSVNTVSRTAGSAAQAMMDLWTYRTIWRSHSNKKVFTAPLTVDIDRIVNGAVDKEIQYL
jgi:hypothetical protein